MRRDITYIQGVEIESAVEIVRNAFFLEHEQELNERVIRSQEEFSNAYGEMLKYRNYEYCISDMHYATGREMFSIKGNCSVCNSPQPFVVDYMYAEERDGKRVPNWRERLICPNCGCNSRGRIMIRKLFDNYQPGMKVLMYEQASGVYQKLAQDMPEMVGFEYPGDGYLGEKNVNGICCEDICDMSFSDEQFDLAISNDVFELAYEYEQAFKEAWRVLKPGGKLIFTVPFNANSDLIARRAKIIDGEIVHIEGEWYHGNPIEGQPPMLVYQIFGWDMLETLKKCGFSDAYGVAYYGIKDGYMGYLPLYFEAVK